MVATLVLMVAGRGIAQLITNGQIITVYYSPYFFIGNGYIFGLPFTLYIVAVVFVIAWLLARRTAFGLFVESVGINARSSFFSGISEKNIKLIVYTICGFCAGIAGLIYSSNVKSADANNAGWGLELDAIASVVIGGTLLSGGYGFVFGTLFGVLVTGLIQMLIQFNGELSSWWTRIAVGALTLIFITVQSYFASRRKVRSLSISAAKMGQAQGVSSPEDALTPDSA